MVLLRSKSNQYPNTSLVQIEGVNTKEEVAWYEGKHMVYIYKSKGARGFLLSRLQTVYALFDMNLGTWMSICSREKKGRSACTTAKSFQGGMIEAKNSCLINSSKVDSRIATALRVKG
ncbi:hypothetical protein L6452_13616 [Arctium lappa]|uniref:Uncharacterized protein n=1 Tax=Arctium lappa TaxID=4217 RepID=A0ACB9CIL1_ARCLA|nr:hypothetical protein L6452_13616 [Arctium lappa]